MTNPKFELDHLVNRPDILTFKLGRNEFVKLSVSTGNLDGLKKARARVKRINASIDHDPKFDAVAEVRKHRRSMP